MLYKIRYSTTEISQTCVDLLSRNGGSVIFEIDPRHIQMRKTTTFKGLGVYLDLDKRISVLNLHHCRAGGWTSCENITLALDCAEFFNAL